jgi:hypothetical protein
MSLHVYMAILYENPEFTPKSHRQFIPLKKVSALVQANPLHLKGAGKPREERLELACEAAELGRAMVVCGGQVKPTLAVARR